MHNFNCHKGEFFTKEKFDFDNSYQKGFDAGYELGSDGKFYKAGGPPIYDLYKGSDRIISPCIHMIEYSKSTRLNHKFWMAGWKDGQNSARGTTTNTKPKLKMSKYIHLYIDVYSGKISSSKPNTSYIDVTYLNSKPIKTKLVNI